MRSRPIQHNYDTCFSRNDLYPYVESFYRRCLQDHDIDGLWAGLERHAAVLKPGFLYFRTLFYDVSLYYAHFFQQQSPLAPRLLAMLTFLLKQGHDPNRVSYYLRTAIDEVRSTPAESLLKAYGALDYASVYDQHKVDPTDSKFISDALCKALVNLGAYDGVQLLVDQGADLNQQDKKGQTLFHHLLHPKAVRTLLVGKKTAELVWTFGSAYYLTHTGYHYGQAEHAPTGYTSYKYYCAPEEPPSAEFLAAIQDILDHQCYTAQDIRTLMALGLDPDIADHESMTPRYMLNHDAYWKAQDIW